MLRLYKVQSSTPFSAPFEAEIAKRSANDANFKSQWDALKKSDTYIFRIRFTGGNAAAAQASAKATQAQSGGTPAAGGVSGASPQSSNSGTINYTQATSAKTEVKPTLSTGATSGGTTKNEVTITVDQAKNSVTVGFQVQSEAVSGRQEVVEAVVRDEEKDHQPDLMRAWNAYANKMNAALAANNGKYPAFTPENAVSAVMQLQGPVLRNGDLSRQFWDTDKSLAYGRNSTPLVDAAGNQIVGVSSHVGGSVEQVGTFNIQNNPNRRPDDATIEAYRQALEGIQ